MVSSSAGVLCVATILYTDVSIKVCANTTTAATTVVMWHSPTHARVCVMTRVLLQIMTLRTLRPSNLNVLLLTFVELLPPTCCCCQRLRAVADLNVLLLPVNLRRIDIPSLWHKMSRGGV